MPNQDRNGRNRPLDRRQQDEEQHIRRNLSDDERDRDRDWSSTERYGQGQSGYGAGRVEGDRSYGSRNQATMTDWDQSRDRGGDDRFSGGRGGQMWSPQDRGAGMYGSSGNYGHSGHWTDDTGGGYLGQAGQQMGYGDQQRDGGMQQRYGGQGYGGSQYGQPSGRYGGNRMIGEPRYSHPGQHGYGQGFGQAGYGGPSPSGYGIGMSEQGMSGSGGWSPYGVGPGYQPEHDVGFRGGQGYNPSFDPQRFDPQPRLGGHQIYGQGYGGSSERLDEGRFERGRMDLDRDRGRFDQQRFDRRWDQSRPSFRGKGPAGYTRSDDRIREMVCDVLTDHHDIDASNIEVAVKSGEVTLSGSVDDRRTKRMVEDVIEDLSGVREVVNQLRVSEKRTSDKHGGPAVEKSGREQELQSGNGGSTDKRHRA